mmetsp:Transcript_89019/g.133490  ORF Transcript_89019/g.133490 Transcript_89019/m.133490 type:complete len:204 (-) Transcript_89019:94-705(-)
MKQPGEFTTEEVLLWLVAIGLGEKQGIFKENALDGDMLVNLSQEDFQNDLGLTKLQAMKVIRSVETSKQIAGAAGSGGSGGADTAALQAQIQALQSENFALKAQLDELMRARQPPAPAPRPAPAPAPKPAPAPAPPPQQRQERHVIKGAAGGAARGALLGTVAGAIAGDAGQGAKIGAAVGATGGAMNGLGARRRARMAGRRR